MNFQSAFAGEYECFVALSDGDFDICTFKVQMEGT